VRRQITETLEKLLNPHGMRMMPLPGIQIYLQLHVILF